MNIYSELSSMHDYLMYKKIPYSNVSVIYRSQDLGLHCIFSGEVKELITDEIKKEIKVRGFSYSITGISKI